MSTRTRASRLTGYLSLALVIVLSSALWASSAWANTNPDGLQRWCPRGCSSASSATPPVVGAGRTTSRNALQPANVPGDLRSGWDLQRCRAQRESSRVLTDTDCPGGTNVGTCVLGMLRSSVTRWTARPSTTGRCWALHLGACGYEAGRICINVPGSAVPPASGEVSPRVCLSGTNAGGVCTSSSACPGGGTCLPADCCEVTPPRFCIGGGNDGATCNVPAECNSGVCARRCVGGTGAACAVDENCASPGVCTGGVPLIRPALAGCNPNPSSGTLGLTSQGAREIPYVVNFADATGGMVIAEALYLNGRSHRDANDENTSDFRQSRISW